MATIDTVLFYTCFASWGLFCTGYLVYLAYCLTRRRGSEITDAFFQAAVTWCIPGRYQLLMAGINFGIAYAMYQYGMVQSGMFFMIMSGYLVLFHSLQPAVLRAGRRRHLLPNWLEG